MKLKGFFNYSKVRIFFTVFALLWTIVFVDLLHFSGWLTGLLYFTISIPLGFILHKRSGAKF